MDGPKVRMTDLLIRMAIVQTRMAALAAKAKVSQRMEHPMRNDATRPKMSDVQVFSVTPRQQVLHP